MKNVVGIVDKVNGCNVKVRYSLSVVNKKYKKRLQSFRYILAHSDMSVQVGEEVVLKSCRPISKTKNYIVVSRRSLS